MAFKSIQPSPLCSLSVVCVANWIIYQLGLNYVRMYIHLHLSCTHGTHIYRTILRRLTTVKAMMTSDTDTVQNAWSKRCKYIEWHAVLGNGMQY